MKIRIALAVNTVGPVRVTRAMLGVIEGLSPADNGSFITRAGEEMAW